MILQNLFKDLSQIRFCPRFHKLFYNYLQNYFFLQFFYKAKQILFINVTEKESSLGDGTPEEIITERQKKVLCAGNCVPAAGAPSESANRLGCSV